MKKLLFLLPFLLLVSGYAWAVTCSNYTSGSGLTCNYPNGWTRVRYINTGSYNLNVSYFFADVYPNDTVFNSYTLSGGRGVGSWNCTDSYTYTPNLYGAYSKCYPLYLPSTMCILESRIYYSNMANPNQPYGYYNQAGSYGQSVTNHRVNTFQPPIASGVNYTYMAMYNGTCEQYAQAGGSGNWSAWSAGYGFNGDNAQINLVPSAGMVLLSPSDNSVQYASITFSINVSNIAYCSSGRVDRRFYDGSHTYYINNTNVSGNGVLSFVISNYTVYGRPFYVSAGLYCNDSLAVFDSHTFAISLNDTMSNKVNGSVLKNLYDSLCFYTPLPESVCNVTTQDVYIKYNGILYYNVNSSNETVFCIRDRNFDGVSTIQILSYCSDSKALIDSQIFGYNFQYQIKHIAQDFSGFVKGVMPPATNFILMFIIVGLIVAVFGAIFNAGVSSWKK